MEVSSRNEVDGINDKPNAAITNAPTTQINKLLREKFTLKWRQLKRSACMAITKPKAPKARKFERTSSIAVK